MENDITQIDVDELNRAANLLSHVAQRRHDLGKTGANTLHALASLVLELMLAFAFSEPVQGATMEDDTTTPPTDDRAVIKPDTMNKFMVGRLEETVTIKRLTPRRLSYDEALNLAAYLIALADQPVAFDHVNAHGAVLSVEFLELLRAVQNS